MPDIRLHGAALHIKGEEDHLDVLAPLVTEYGEAWVFTTLHLINVGSGRSQKKVVELRIDDQPIGRLTPAVSSHYIPTIDHLALSDQLIVAKTLLKGNPIQVEAVLHAARSHELDAAWFAPARSQPNSPSSASPEPATSDMLPSPLTPAVSVASQDSRPVHIPPKPTEIVFQAPPGWPPPPEGWEPSAGWQPDPGWPPPPPDWQFWALR